MEKQTGGWFPFHTQSVGNKRAGCLPRGDSRIHILFATFYTVCRAVKSQVGFLMKVCACVCVCGGETMEVIRVVRFVLEELPFFCKETASVKSLQILFSFFCF